MAAMKTIVEMIHLPLKCRHVEGLGFSWLDQSCNFHIWPIINLGSLHWSCDKEIYKHYIIDGYRFHMCYDHCHNARKSGLNQHNVNWFGTNTQSSQILLVTSPVLLSTFKCSQTPLELSKVLSDSVRAFSDSPESICSYGGAFQILQDLTYRIVKFQSSWDVCVHLW